MDTCDDCGNPGFAPHSAACSRYTPDIHRVDEKCTHPRNRRAAYNGQCLECGLLVESLSSMIIDGHRVYF